MPASPKSRERSGLQELPARSELGRCSRFQLPPGLAPSGALAAVERARRDLSNGTLGAGIAQGIADLWGRGGARALKRRPPWARKLQRVKNTRKE